MRFEPAPLAGLTVVFGQPRVDERGRFVRVYDADKFAAVRRDLTFVQVNLSRTTRRGTVRGMHFQWPPAADAKLVRCVHGAVFDVAVDLRTDSPTFLRWHGVKLSAAAELGLLIPEGFAHGFQALTDDAEILYMHTAAYTPELEGGLRHDDPRLDIRWPLSASNVSARDRSFALLDPTFPGIST
ncbi:MAG: dTDP-4-dehydrorhamnose 3,5-epimerase [Burkholderiales bacterium]|nr:dTDP-4-dehydrorhamnose 3,5-epimerase [Burkholderiales bacterium]